MTDRSLVLVIDVLLQEAGGPKTLTKKIFWLLSDNEQPTDWAAVEDLSYYRNRLVTIKKLEQKYQNSQDVTKNGSRLGS